MALLTQHNFDPQVGTIQIATAVFQLRQLDIEEWASCKSLLRIEGKWLA
jgi:hypothetical protein